MLYGLRTLVYYIPPDPDLRFKCQSDKILIPISKNPYLMDEDSSPNPRIDYSYFDTLFSKYKPK